MFEATNSVNHFWYAIKRWRHRDIQISLQLSDLQLGEDSTWVFHQGNIQLFGKTAGIKCACNALYALINKINRSL